MQYLRSQFIVVDVSYVVYLSDCLLYICRQLLIADPTDDEEDLSAGRFSIVMDDEEEICYVHKPGAYFIFVKCSVIL